MDNTSNKNSENMQNSNEKEKSIITPESLLKIMTTMCFSRIGTPKIEGLKEDAKSMLKINSDKNPERKKEYSQLEELIEKFFEYITNPIIVKQVKNGEISRKDFEEMILSDILDIPKRKYDMRDLYDKSLIMDSIVIFEKDRESHSESRQGMQTREYFDKDGKMVSITKVGDIAYKEWGGIMASLPIFKVKRFKQNGDEEENLVCSRINFSQMHESKYRNAVINELLSEKNIHNSNVGSYVGQIVKREIKSESDEQHEEVQNTNEYSYRIDDEYVLVYDATELSAVIEGIRNYKEKSKRKILRTDEIFEEMGDI